MTQAFKGVVWPRGKRGQLYSYAVIGVLVTDRPIEGIEGKNEVVLRSGAYGMAEALSGMTQVKPQLRIGDANMVLTNLNEITEPRDDDEPI